MGAKESTVRMRELGVALRKAARRAGLSNNQIAHRLGWSNSKVSNIFGAHRGVSEADAASILALCGSAEHGGAERARLLRLCRDSHQLGWWQEYGDRLPPKLRTLIDHEDSAIAVSGYHSLLVPGLLQVADYTRASMRGSATIPEHEIDERVEARIKRQEIFDRSHPAHFKFFIDEYASNRAGIPQDIMSAQVHHLLRMSIRPYVEIRIIPESVGFHAGFSGPFVFMEFAEIKPVVHLEHETSSVFAERPETTGAYRRILRALAEIALDSEQSMEWIARRASDLGDPGEEHDDPA